MSTPAPTTQAPLRSRAAIVAALAARAGGPDGEQALTLDDLFAVAEEYAIEPRRARRLASSTGLTVPGAVALRHEHIRRLAAAGHTDDQIAEALGVRPHLVRASLGRPPGGNRSSGTREAKRAAALAALREGASVREACEASGLCPVTVRRIAKEHQIVPERSNGSSNPERDADILADYLGGASRGEVAAAYGLSLQRASSCIEREAARVGLVKEAARQHDQPHVVQHRAARHAALLARIRATAAEHPDAPASTLLAMLNPTRGRRAPLTREDLAEALGVEGMQRRVTGRAVQAHYDEADLLGALRAAADAVVAANGQDQPLTVAAYSRHRDLHGGPSVSLLTLRLGSWAAALHAAGLGPAPAPRPVRPGVWTAAAALSFVRRFLAEHPDGTSIQYGAWARATPGAPSESTVRARCGTWTAAVREAVRAYPETVRLLPVAVAAEEQTHDRVA